MAFPNNVLNIIFLQAILDAQQHSISYTLSRNQAVIVEYQLDTETDMFQIGRSSETPIDFVVMDTIPGDKHGELKASCIDQTLFSVNFYLLFWILLFCNIVINNHFIFSLCLLLLSSFLLTRRYCPKRNYAFSGDAEYN